MTWLDEIENRIGYPSAVVSERRFVEDNTTIDLTSLPNQSLVLRVRHLERRRSGLSHAFEGRRRCDLVALIDSSTKPRIVFIEAKSGKDSNNVDSADATHQLASSIEIMSDAVNDCALELPFANLSECEVTAVCAMESLRGSRTTSRLQRRFTARFYRDNRVPLHYLSAGRDIWQEIRGVTT